jgi:tetratricopeptide (TPR) repeat protein
MAEKSKTIEVNPRPQLSLSYAVGLLEMGMYRESLALFDKLPDDVRQRSTARRAELKAATALGQWQRALKLASLLRDGDEFDREAAAADAFQNIAAEASKRGREADALKLANLAIRARPEHSNRFRDDERFPNAFRARFGMKLQSF